MPLEIIVNKEKFDRPLRLMDVIIDENQELYMVVQTVECEYTYLNLQTGKLTSDNYDSLEQLNEYNNEDRIMKAVLTLE